MEVSFALKTAIELAQNGNKSSFEFIYKETFSFAWHRANVIVNYNQEAAADIVQDTYIICYQQLPTLENINAFYSWLSSIIYHLGMQFFRKQKRELLMDENIFDWNDYVSIDDIQNNPELSAEENATKKIVKELIETLPEIQKITLLAYYFDGLKVEDIAHVMQCPESTVKSRLNYARTSLKTAIERLEKKHGYRIHAINFPIIYYALKEILANTELDAECKSPIFQNIRTKLNSVSSGSKGKDIQNDCPNEAEPDFISNVKYTASISAVLDSNSYITDSIGSSAVLTAALTGFLNPEPLNMLNVFQTDFASLITSLKTKFALASAATAIGNSDIMFLQDISLPPVCTNAIESILTGTLTMYDDILEATTINLDMFEFKK